MAFIHGKASAIAVASAAGAGNFKDMTAYTNQVTLPRNIDMAETSVFGNTYKTYIQGLADATISIQGRYDAVATVGPDVVLSGLIGLSTPVTLLYAPAGYTGAFANPIPAASATQPYVYGQVYLASYEITSQIGDVVSFQASFQLASALTRATAGTVASS